MTDQIEKIAHALYLADLQYDGSGDRYAYLAKAALTFLVASRVPASAGLGSIPPTETSFAPLPLRQI